MKKFFEVPTQVMFWDVDGNHYIGGIAYHDEIICGCCGGIVSIEEVYEFTPTEVKEPVHVFDKYWVDISHEIIGN